MKWNWNFFRVSFLEDSFFFFFFHSLLHVYPLLDYTGIKLIRQSFDEILNKWPTFCLFKASTILYSIPTDSLWYRLKRWINTYSANTFFIQTKSEPLFLFDYLLPRGEEQNRRSSIEKKKKTWANIRCNALRWISFSFSSSINICRLLNYLHTCFPISISICPFSLLSSQKS